MVFFSFVLLALLTICMRQDPTEEKDTCTWRSPGSREEKDTWKSICMVFVPLAVLTLRVTDEKDK